MFSSVIQLRITIDVPKNLTNNASLNIEFQFETEELINKHWFEKVFIYSSKNESSQFFWEIQKQEEELLEEFTTSTREGFKNGLPL